MLIDAGVRWGKAIAPRKNTAGKKRLTSVGHGEDWGAITKLNWRSTIITDEAKGLDQNRVTFVHASNARACALGMSRSAKARFKGKSRPLQRRQRVDGHVLQSRLQRQRRALSLRAHQRSRHRVQPLRLRRRARVRSLGKRRARPRQDRRIEVGMGQHGSGRDFARTLRPARNLARQYSRRRPQRVGRRTGRRSEELGGAHQRRHAGATRVAAAVEPNAARAGRQRRHETPGRRRHRTAGRFAISREMGAPRSQSTGRLDAFASDH